MRLIDADKTLETLEGLTELAIGEGAALVKALTFAALKSESVVPTIGGWISVKDRLPEAIKRALVAADFSGVMDVDVAMYCGNGMWESTSGLYPQFSVTHWMPLPEPPEEVSGDGVAED